MKEEKYGKMLTIMLIIIVAILIILIGFFVVRVYTNSKGNKEAEKAVDQYINRVGNKNEVTLELQDDPDLPNISMDENEIQQTQTSSGTTKTTYKGYNVIGTIEIPKIDLKYPILERATTSSIEVSVAKIYGPGPNQVGNTVIVGHNYRNGSFFGNNDRLSENDKIYITDSTGTRLKYNIYKIYTTTPDDGDYMIRDTQGKREVSLSTCTDNSQNRLIIWAVEE